MHFTLAKQEALIRNHGTQCLVLPVMQCPCLTAERQFNPLCTGCQGTGRYYPPGTTYTTTLLMTKESSKRAFDEPGTWTEGTILASVLPGVRLCERDKVRVLDIKDTFTDEVLVRGLDDTVRFTAGVELELVADLNHVYQPGTDYVLTTPNTVTWLTTGTQPSFGAQYSVKYSAYPEYLCVGDSPRMRVEYRRPQAQEVKLMRLDKIGEDA